jgi:hypothetical protein
MRSIALFTVLLLAPAGLLVHAAPARETLKAGDAPQTRLTIYHDDFAIVTHRRTLAEQWQKGLNSLRFADVAATIEPASVRFRSLTDPGASVMEQGFEFDILSTERLLQKNLDRRITVHTSGGKKYVGVLLNYDARHIVLTEDQDKGPAYVLNRGDHIQRIEFAVVPEGLRTRPTLQWEVHATKPGQHEVELSYIARDIRWRCDYQLVLNRDDTTADLTGWVTVDNRSGTTFRDAAVKLLAGEPKTERAPGTWAPAHEAYRFGLRKSPTGQGGSDPGRTLAEYRIYQLPARQTINDKQVRQMELIRATGIPVVKSYLYDGSRVTGQRGVFTDPKFGRDDPNRKVDVVLEIDNRADKNLGVVLPIGKWRSYKKDTGGSLEFLGEDYLPHANRDEKVIVAVGQAFDIVAEHKVAAFVKVNDHVSEETIEVHLRNRKQEPVTIQVLEKMHRSADWTILDKSHEFTPLDQRTLLFPVTAKPDEEVLLTYRVRYQF